MIDPEIQAQILTLYYSDKRSMESISRELGINRKTVIRVVQRRSVLLVPRERDRSSHLDPFKEMIRAQLRKDQKVTGTAVLNNLRGLGYTGGITILRDFLVVERGRMARPREAFLRLEFGPGEVAQVDWGEFGDVFGDGIKVHCFAMVMAFSRMIYVEFTRSEKFEEFIRCHEHAFRFFDGVPRECWYDNLATAVSDRMGGLIRFNSRFMAYMGHHSVRPHACNVASGNEKGRVEDLIKYIRMNFWSGRSFSDFDDLTKQFMVWRDQIANSREHRTTRRVVRLLFESEEKSKLMPVNPVPYDTDEIFSRNVTSDFHLQYETNRYSVPWTLVGLTITVRVNSQELKVYYNEKFICSQVRSYLKNKVFTTEAHRAGLLERKPGATRETWQLGYVKGLGPRMAEYVELVRRGPRSLKYELSRLVALVTVYGEQMVLDACAECLKSGIVGVDNLELFLKRQHHPSQTNLHPELIKFNNEKLNRVHPAVDLRKYDALYFEGENHMSASKEEKNGDNEHKASGGLVRAEVEILGSGTDGRSSEKKDQDRELISKYLSQWIEMEKSERYTSMIQSKIRTAKFRRVQTVENYDFRYSKMTEKVEKNYLSLHAGISKDNLPSAVLTGNAGTGKTHLARALGYASCQKGLSVLFITAAEMVNHLQHAQKTFNLEAELNKYRKPQVLIIDELGYVALDTQASNLFFQVISSRHDAELGTIATTNLPFGKFNQIFANDAIAHAIVDRLVNEAEVFYMEGDSYRPHQRQEKLKRKKQNA